MPNLLKKAGNSAFVYLESLLSIIEPDNAIEIEAEAAKTYFRALFGSSFIRRSENSINSALNYGYSVILSAVNRIIVSHGYNTSLALNVMRSSTKKRAMMKSISITSPQ